MKQTSAKHFDESHLKPMRTEMLFVYALKLLQTHFSYSKALIYFRLISKSLIGSDVARVFLNTKGSFNRRFLQTDVSE